MGVTGGAGAPQGPLRARHQTCVFSISISLSSGGPEHAVFHSAFCLISRVASEWCFCFHSVQNNFYFLFDFVFDPLVILKFGL